MYKVQNSEQTREKTCEYETKSLLYLLAIHKERTQIEFLIIDFFNDVTGANVDLKKLWDVQVKGRKKLNPKKIGQSLITLFQNFTSEVKFYEFSLFMPPLNEDYLVDKNKLNFGISNFNLKVTNKIKKGLIEEFNRRFPSNPISNSDQNLNFFLNKIIFVIDSGDKANYIREIINFKDKSTLKESLLISIFNEIMDKQSCLKNNSVEGTEIEEVKDSLKYEHHICKDEIILLVMNRIVGGTDFFENRSIPISFKDETNGLDIEDTKDLILDCKSKIFQAFFNKNNRRGFWIFFEKLIDIITNNPQKDIRFLYNSLLSSGIKIIPPLEEKSILYFISLIKDRIDDDN